MNKLSKAISLASTLLPLSVSAEIQAIDEGALALIVGQSGIVTEERFGTGPVSLFEAPGKWADAGITIEAFKWQVDVQAWDSGSNNVKMSDPADGSGATVYGGFVARDIQLAGGIDTYIDAVFDNSVLDSETPGYNGTNDVLSGAGGIGITFANSNMSFRVGDVGVYLAGVGQISSIGTVELIGFRIDGLELVMRGNGL